MITAGLNIALLLVILTLDGLSWGKDE
jgi:hypothetical protein